jgi:5-methylcytosine-specific restriction endonuclease McrA
MNQHFTPEQLAEIERIRGLTPAQRQREYVLNTMARLDREAEAFEVEYQSYIHSDVWRAKAEAAIERAGGRCQVCNGRSRLNVHHRTYQQLGREADTDLIVLCRFCHELFHKHGKLQR